MSDSALKTTLLQAAQTYLPDDALQSVRASALAALEHAGLPTTRDEDWKYTNLSRATDVSNAWLQQLPDAGVPANGTGLTELPDVDAHWLRIQDGVVDDAALETLGSLRDRGVTLAHLRDQPDSVRVDGPYDRLNAALLRDGLHVSVSANSRLDKPLGILFSDGTQSASQSRVVIDVGPGADIDIIELHESNPGAADDCFTNTVTQLTVAAGARAGYVRIQDRGRQQIQVGKLVARLLRNSTVDYASFDLGGALVRQDVDVDIVEPGAAVHMNGLYLAGGRQHVDNHTRIDHRVGPASSREVFHGIVSDNARCVFNGKAVVHAGADGSDAEQSNHNLLLSERAEVDTKPELEIYADDVKCSHGATVGQLDESALFYMRSRGLDTDQARHMLTRAFAGQVLARSPIAAVAPLLESRIDARLNTLLEEHGT